jgi:hypothetical protein
VNFGFIPLRADGQATAWSKEDYTRASRMAPSFVGFFMILGNQFCGFMKPKLTKEVESAVLGIHHGEIGGKLAQHWNFPKEISEAILDHHNINPRAPGAPLIQLADLIAHNSWFSDELKPKTSSLTAKSGVFADVDPKIIVDVAREIIQRDNEVQKLSSLIRSGHMEP